jgi:hypothetical protein
MSAEEVEWRVIAKYPPGDAVWQGPPLSSELEARNCARLEVQQNPLAEVVLERREVGPWTAA